MPKYYVRSGQLEQVVIASNPLDAATRALLLCDGEEIDPLFFYVDERGFRGPTPMDNTVSTDLMPEHSIKSDEIFHVEGDE